MSITLLIMAAVVTVFANISNSVTNRRATIEMSSALRNVRETLARDLAGATCPAVPWQRPEANHGYLEVIEGPQNDYYPTPFLWDGNASDNVLSDPVDAIPGIDLEVSSLPGSDLGGDPINDIEGTGRTIGAYAPLNEETPTDGRGLGDADDILMLTVRNEDEPFVGRIPAATDPANPTLGFGGWSIGQEVESQLAEVVWFAVENPAEATRSFAFGEPGYRTIYRRALLVLPELDYQIYVTGNGLVNANSSAAAAAIVAGPGTVRVLRPNVLRNQVAVALASLIAFQERYDLSVRLEWDTNLPNTNISTGFGRWVLRANSLADLTKRENRYEHHGFVPQPVTLPIRHNATRLGADRFFPFAVASAGLHSTSTTLPVALIADSELASTAAGGVRAVTTPTIYNNDARSWVVAFQTDAANRGAYLARPLVVVNNQTDMPATARAILDESGQVVHVTSGLVPLGGARRGDDIMMTDALSFDLKLYDPGAPLYGYVNGGGVEQVIAPSDPAWPRAYHLDTVSNLPGDGVAVFPFVGQGAYVDAGYGLTFANPQNVQGQLANRYARTSLRNRWDEAAAEGILRARFFSNGLIRTAVGPEVDADTGQPLPNFIVSRFACYDTWSTHYESNGLNEDGDIASGQLRTAAAEPALTDEGVNGQDDVTIYDRQLATAFGPDDAAERETRPPYDTALRGMQVSLRVYERDSRQIREVRVRESFVPE